MQIGLTQFSSPCPGLRSPPPFLQANTLQCNVFNDRQIHFFWRDVCYWLVFSIWSVNSSLISFPCQFYVCSFCHLCDVTGTVYFATFLVPLFSLLMTFCQVGGGTLVVEPGEGRDPLTVNDQVALKLSRFYLWLRHTRQLMPKIPLSNDDQALIDHLG